MNPRTINITKIIAIDILCLSCCLANAQISWTEHTIAGDFNGARSVYAMDVDGDGDVDVLGAAWSADDITWWENNGSESFTEHTIDGDFDGAYSVYATDVDGDGDVDVLGAASSADDITWWENDGNQQFSEQTIAGNFDYAVSVYATDIDGDGDVDVLGAAWSADDITWWENNGSESFTEHTIDGDFNGANSVYATDVDGDGDVDVLGAASSAGDITWWENNGSESFTEHTIDGDFAGARSVYATDVDGDGDVDVLGAASGAYDITWWENNGSESFTEHTIDGDFDGAYSVYATDVDGDGDMDVLGAAYWADDITWWENNGSESFTEHTIDGDFNDAMSVYATDVDGDGDVDVLGAASGAGDITWWESDLAVPPIEFLGVTYLHDVVYLTYEQNQYPDILDVEVRMRNVTSNTLEDVEVLCYADGVLIPVNLPSSLDQNGDGKIDNINPNSTLHAPVATRNIPPIWEDVDLSVQIVSIGGEPTAIEYETNISVYYVEDAGRVFQRIPDYYRFDNYDLTFTEWWEYQSDNLFEGVVAPENIFMNLIEPLSSWGGHCYGMAASSAIYFVDESTKPVNLPTNEMLETDDLVTDEILTYHVNLLYRPHFLSSDPLFVYNLVRSQILNNEPPILAMEYGFSNGHAVVGHSVYVDNDNNIAYVRVYDNAYESTGQIKKMILDFDEDNIVFWSHEDISVSVEAPFVSDNVVGSLNDYFFAQMLVYYWQQVRWLGFACPVNVSITDNQGRTSGYLENGTSVAEIPDVTFYKLPTYDAVGDSLTVFTIPDDIEFIVESYGYAGAESFIEFLVPGEQSGMVYSYDSVTVTGNSQATFNVTELGYPSTLENDLDGNGVPDEYIDPDSSLVLTVRENGSESAIPQQFILASAYPNPFNASVTIQYGLPVPSHVELTVYDILGRKVAVIDDQMRSAGNHEIIWDAANFASGIYFYSIEAGEFNAVKKMVLMK